MCGCSVTGWAQVLCVLGLSRCQGQRELGEEVSIGMSYLHSQKHPCLEQSLPWESPALHRRCQHPSAPSGRLRALCWHQLSLELPRWHQEQMPEGSPAPTDRAVRC